MEIYHLGKNAKDNHFIIDYYLDINPNFIWMHLSDYPSPHLIIKKENPTQEDLIKGALMIINKTKNKLHQRFNKDNNDIKIDYISLQYVKKTKTLGQVILLHKPYSFYL
jgi:predicted ribosome quality control (RQC) complex YloA/Tae2 family protein